MATKSKAVFLDRDGVINVDADFVHKVEDLAFYPGTLEAIKQLAQSDYKIIIITNQAGIGRGIFSEEQFHIFQKEMIRRIEAAGGRIDAYYFCPHHPTKGVGEFLKQCECRKPKPGMLLKAQAEHAIEFDGSWMIGDKRSDVKVGAVVGCQTILVQTGNAGKGGNTDEDVQPTHIAEDLFAAVQIILGNKS